MNKCFKKLRENVVVEVSNITVCLNSIMNSSNNEVYCTLYWKEFLELFLGILERPHTQTETQRTETHQAPAAVNNASSGTSGPRHLQPPWCIPSLTQSSQIDHRPICSCGPFPQNSSIDATHKVQQAKAKVYDWDGIKLGNETISIGRNN